MIRNEVSSWRKCDGQTERTKQMILDMYRVKAQDDLRQGIGIVSANLGPTRKKKDPKIQKTVGKTPKKGPNLQFQGQNIVFRSRATKMSKTSSKGAKSKGGQEQRNRDSICYQPGKSF